MQAIYIRDPRTEAAARQLASLENVPVTEAVGIAVLSELERRGVAFEMPAGSEPPADDLEEQLRHEMREATREYVKLRKKHEHKTRSHSRVFQMLPRLGAVGTIEKLVSKPAEGLKLCVELGRVDLSAEWIALKSKYNSIIRIEIRENAERNLLYVGVTRKPD